MTRDEEIIQKFEEKAGSLLGKAQQYLTATLPGGPGVFAYVVASSLVGKLFGHTKNYVQNAIKRPVTISSFVYVEPLDEELEAFFDNVHFKSVRAEFPKNYEDFSDSDWSKMRRYYKPLYYSFYFRDPFMTEMFAYEIKSKNYKRIIQDFELLPMYKQALDSIPSASRQNALWNAVTSILKDTVNEVWSKNYAKQVFEEARLHPEVAELIENIKAKIQEKVNIDQLKEWRDDLKYLTGRGITVHGAGMASETSMQAVEFVTRVLPNGGISVPPEFVRKLRLTSGATVRVLLLENQ
ncbi:hypothetical protein U27_01095 [Candidatus Vecturithrix granuli]|uniref:Uncharacterized protein n=1 Tax=Vecturithrix granuli TaxID=1499967 RepID=A0A081C9E1_VECG1|nr:hypothetical protein U27_01095 [Candidatus Vecturithrix granuli]